MTAQQRVIGDCRDCHTPLVPAGKRPIPPGHARHAARHRCNRCHLRARRQRQVNARIAMGLARQIAATAPLPETLRDTPCTQTDPEIFFPPPGHEPIEALAICATCPVRVECATYATKTGQYGVWGGTTTEDRRRATTYTDKDQHQ